MFFLICWIAFGRHFDIFGCILDPFWTPLVASRMFLALFWCLLNSVLIHWAPFWSIWFHLHALKPMFCSSLVSWHPGISGTPDSWDPCFDSFRFWFVFQRIPLDCCIDLSIVFSQSLFVSGFYFRTTSNPTLWHTHTHTHTQRKTSAKHDLL